MKPQEVLNWDDKTFLAKVLQGGDEKKPNVSIISFSGKPATAPGENFSSDIFRVRVHYKLGGSPEELSKSIIIKVPDTAGIVPAMGGQGVFEKEVRFYRKLLPKMNKLLKCKMAPSSFYTPIKNLLIMDDLKQSHTQVPISKQFDYAHSKAVFEYLAKFHASSVAIHHEEPKLIEVNTEPYFREGGLCERWVKLGCKTFGNILSEIDGCSEYAEFYKNRVDSVWESCVEVVKSRPGHLNVLNHGDAWINNMLFKFNKSKEIIDVKFIDFQVSKFASPVFDLFNAMYTSVRSEVREHHQQDLLDVYLETLNTTLEQLGCQERMSATELKEHIRFAMPWFIALVTFQVSVVIVGGSEGIDPFTCDDIVTGKADPILLKMFHSTVLRPHLVDITRHYFALLAP